jgi:tripartite-type tricarboxylate transporter receptor subunit TctC
VARHIGEHIPGAPTVIVVNMPGGGGLVAANHVFSAAAKDGTVIGLFHEAQMMNQLTGGEGVNFDLRQFNARQLYDDPNVIVETHRFAQGNIGHSGPMRWASGPESNATTRRACCSNDRSR